MSRVTEVQAASFKEAMAEGDLTRILALAETMAFDAEFEAIYNYKHPPTIEKTRTYVYANGDIALYREVTKHMTDTHGNHTLTMQGGFKAVVAPGWRAIEIETGEVQKA